MDGGVARRLVILARGVAAAVEEVGELVLVHTNGTCCSKFEVNAQYDIEHHLVRESHDAGHSVALTTCASSRGQPAVGAVRSGLHGSDRHAQLVGDLAMGHADEVCEPHDLALVGRKLGEGGPHLPRLPRPLERQRDHRDLVVAGLVGRGGTPLAPVDVDGDAPGDGVEPRCQFADGSNDSAARQALSIVVCTASSARSRLASVLIATVRMGPA